MIILVETLGEEKVRISMRRVAVHYRSRRSTASDRDSDSDVSTLVLDLGDPMTIDVDVGVEPETHETSPERWVSPDTFEKEPPFSSETIVNVPACSSCGLSTGV